MFSKILIANRGEIAVRVIRACKEMGIATVAVYSTADADALHVHFADEAYCVGPAPARQSYLNMGAILSAATVSGAQAVHPGYGLLSENARFAALCQQCGIAFIGPSPEILRKMGDKDEARRTMKAAGVPLIPGTDVLATAQDAQNAARDIGFPLLIKARAGGGGRGIRRVDAPDGVEKAFLTASAEAQAAFGDGSVYIEKLLQRVKHIETQILADSHGNVVILGERDCSVQRNNQKLIEESPSVCVNESTRAALFDVSRRAAQAVGYQGAGTVEFLLDGDGNFYFMEMNTRLQVEHPVTEMVSGVDIVKWQIRVAAGLPLDFGQDDIALSGHSIECRINAEDPANGFKPCGGTITTLHVPGGPWVRFDTAAYQDYTVPPFYDSLVGKLVVHAKTRGECIRKMKAALCELVIEGIEHTASLQYELLDRKEFTDGSYTTKFLEERVK
ncbi:MAG: acetyl-CoA carboxylase biotin carboxylase subunit [Oscillospiraceae bacterium]|jgi:acetyl-CoA carboxylase biotin carboxylase subunit|nr:acetyl-CoA carboxylase biotin carboxylase subunit [Oscillospiraceae bacterium]